MHCREQGFASAAAGPQLSLSAERGPSRRVALLDPHSARGAGEPPRPTGSRIFLCIPRGNMSFKFLFISPSVLFWGRVGPCPAEARPSRQAPRAREGFRGRSGVHRGAPCAISGPARAVLGHWVKRNQLWVRGTKRCSPWAPRRPPKPKRAVLPRFFRTEAMARQATILLHKNLPEKK